jgi:hypothetical protein
MHPTYDWCSQCELNPTLEGWLNSIVSGDMRYSASNPLCRKFHFSALRHGDDGVVGRVAVCGWVSSSVFFWRLRRNHTPRVGPRQPSLYSTRFLKIGLFTFLGCVFYGSQKHKKVQSRHLVLSQFWLVLSKNHLVLSQFRLVHTQNSPYFVEKIIIYCPKISTDFYQISVLYCPNFGLYCPKIDLNFSKNLSRFRFNIKFSSL